MTSLAELVKRLREYADPNRATHSGVLWEACDEAANYIEQHLLSRDAVLEEAAKVAETLIVSLHQAWTGGSTIRRHLDYSEIAAAIRALKSHPPAPRRLGLGRAKSARRGGPPSP
jgi:hypothetical protein